LTAEVRETLAAGVVIARDGNSATVACGE